MNILLIPSAVLIPIDMRNDLGDIPTGLYPVNNKAIIYHIIEKYDKKVDKIYVIIYEKGEYIKEYIENKYPLVEFIQLDKLKDLGYSIKYAIEKIILTNKEINKLYINYADSIIEENINTNIDNYIYYTKKEENDKWTYFYEKDGKLLNILDKSNLYKKTNESYSFNKLIIGLFCINDINYFFNMFKLIDENLSKIDSFYKAIYLYSIKYKFEYIKVNSWIDIGHIENYKIAKTKVAARSFNFVSIDEKRGILTKKSNNKNKLIDEINWYLKMPNRLQYLLPRIYEYSLDKNNPYVKMEYYGYHTLHEYLLYGNLSKEKWINIFEQLLFIMSDMQSFKKIDNKEKFIKAIDEMYIKKTIERLKLLENKKEFNVFFSNNVIINGKKYMSLNEYIDILPILVNKILKQNIEKYFSIIHGDLCFTNILTESTYNFMKVIDPRGRFGDFSIYGDYRYELAKLLHTLEGKYDYIIEDMFRVKIENNKIDIKIYSKNDYIYDIFKDVFKEKLSDIAAIRLIEGTLFLSMIPLHCDYLNRQYAMLATGIKLINYVLEENSINVSKDVINN